MNKSYVIAIAIVVLIAVIAFFTYKPVPVAPTNSTTNYILSTTSSTSTTTIVNITTTTTVTSTTSTITPPARIKLHAIYFLNESNGTYYYVATLNESEVNATRGVRVTNIVVNGIPTSDVAQYLYGNYVLVVFGVPQAINGSVLVMFELSNAAGFGYNMPYMGKWPYGNVIP